ncbi:electron transfer flavoprotein subunit alpha/FixB family protein [Varunaivibrio sulfuroxidans]|uniref:Electron transfer flavoprotein subunit alpha n=1 Tax=Varunaivibrio sulfuroxidans TaxID=1773489 RepID=A0A4R3JFS8_9PROT|nr:FAD-binding protein [Varunaivibrio sulfuroxidans]TCS63540.1 electron transfer flavoprotein alpha subunit apoprotein [Varunaivibrio sulfuroxidans]WES30315.1 FAD-binding protein [Varunaivibrio sulfuroxidans]
MNVLVLGEHDNRDLKAATLHTITAAGQLGAVDVLIAGENCDQPARQAAAAAGVRRVLVVDDPAFAHPLAEVVAPLLVSLAENYEAVLAGATTTGKNTLPRAAALLDVAQISDVIAVLGPDTFKRPIYAGNAIATVTSSDRIKVLTVRTTAFDAAPSGADEPAPIDTLAFVPQDAPSRFVGAQLSHSERPELTDAKIIVSGGRGLGSAENFKLIENLADTLGAAVGASRAAVDAGYVPNDYQVGQTGKVVAPNLYVAVGISGAIQHLAGMKDSRVIVAINKDEEAPIFQVADYGLVADLFTALPELTAALNRE